MEIISFDSEFTQQTLVKELIHLNPGTRVAIKMSNGVNLAHVLATCFKNDLVSIPLNPHMSKAQETELIEHCQPHILVDDKDIKWVKQTKKLLVPNDLAFIIYTSGSTASPKGVMQSKNAVIANAMAVSKRHGFSQNHCHATCLPFYHCNAIMMSLIGTLLVDGTLFLQSTPKMDCYLDDIKAVNATSASIVPALLHDLVHYKKEWPQNLKYLITAAHDLKPNLAKRFFDLYGSKIVQGYGLTEAVNFSFVMPNLDEASFSKEYIHDFPPIGLPLEGTEYKIEDNELLVKGPNNMIGYLNNKIATLDTITSDGWLKTGDLAQIRNGYVVLSGRKKEIINRGGETLYPNYLEETLLKVGLPQNTIVHGISNNVLSEDIAISINAKNYSIEKIINLLDDADIKYSGLSFCNGIYTTTKKPMRSRMSKGMFSINENKLSYEELLNYAIVKSKEICGFDESKITNPMAKFIYQEAKQISSVDHHITSNINKNCPAYTLITSIVEHWEKLARGKISGEDLIKMHKGLWMQLMNDWPMGEYAQFAAGFLKENALLTGDILEVGAGVGNVSRLVYQDVDGNYTRTDLHDALLNKYSYSALQESYDFNYPGRWKNLDTIFGVNALHCATNKEIAIFNLFDMLKEGGYLVIAEGSPVTIEKYQTPWALNYSFGLFQGWYDIGGFIKREAWMSYFKEVGFRSFGALKLRSGRHDLGGIIWGKK